MEYRQYRCLFEYYIASQSKLKVLLQLYPQYRSIEGQFGAVAHLEVKLLRVEIKHCQLRVTRVVTCCQNIRNPLSIHASVICTQEIIHAGVPFVFMHCHDNNIVHLLVGLCITEILVVVHSKFFVTVLYQPECHVLYVTHTQVDRTGAVSGSQISKSLINRLAKLKRITNRIGPRLTQTCFVLLYGGLLSDFLSDSCKFSKTSQTTDKACPGQVDKWMGPFFLEVIKNEYGVLVDWISHIPIQSSQMKQVSILSGFAPAPQNRAPSSRVLRDHVELDQSSQGYSGPLADSCIFFMISPRSIGLCDHVIGIEKVFVELDGKGTAHRLQGCGQFGDPFKLLFCQRVIVAPQIPHQIFDFVLHERTVGKSGLIRISPQPEDKVALVEITVEVRILFAELMDF